MGGSTFVKAETVAVAVLVSGWVVGLLIRRLGRSRGGLDIGMPIAVGFGIRMAAIAGVSSTGLSSALRGGDEQTFLFAAHRLAESPWGHGFWPHGIYKLHTVVFAIQLKIADFSEGALRVTQVGIATTGLVLVLAAVQDLAGRRAARTGAWILAFEPASVFFNSALHKEPLMVLASGMVVYGGTKLWRRLDLSGIVLMGLGCLIAVETRPYAGWFLVSGSVLVILHGALRRMDRPLRAMPLIYGVILAAFIAAPAVTQVTSSKSLKTLQQSQDANASAKGTPGNNLALEKVNYSTRGQVFKNLPKRMADVIFRPYPWQVGNASQQLGAAGSLFAFAGLLLLLRAAWRRRRHVLADTAPILYPMVFLLMAYALSAGNAGTGFRYRTHIVMLGLAMMAVLAERVRQARAEAQERVRNVPSELVPWPNQQRLANPVTTPETLGGRA